MKYALSILLLCASAAWSQDLSEPAFVGSLNDGETGAPSSFDPTSITNLALYLSYEDLPIAVPFGWTNKVAPFQVFTNQGTVNPSNTYSGLYFDGTTATSWLKNSTSGIRWTNGYDSLWVCLTNVTFGGTYDAIIGMDAAATVGLYASSTAPTFRTRGSGVAVDFAGSMSGTAQYDLAIVPNGANWDFYTNGVANLLGTSGPNINNTAKVWGIGHDNGGNNNVRGYIKAILVYTNHTLTAQELADLHTFALSLTRTPEPNTNWFQLDITTTASPETFTVGLVNPNNLLISWGDGSTNTATGNTSHSYTNAGNYVVSLQGYTEGLRFDTTPHLIRRIKNGMKGVSGITSMQSLFYGATNLSGSIPADLFDYQTNCTVFASAFAGCRGLTSSIPIGLFDSNYAAVNMSSVFSGCTNLNLIPEDLFRYCTNVTSFSFAFYGDLEYNSSIPYIPTNLFQYNTKVLTMDGLFYKNGGITNIPPDLFRYCTNARDMSFVFANASKLQVGIPEDLFRYNPLVTNLSYCLHACAVTGSIPAGLFAYNTNVTSLAQCLNSVGLTNAIPSGLFDSCSNVVLMSGLFGGSHVTSIPSGLFDKNTAATTFENAFYGCPSLTSIPNLLFDKNTAAVDFDGCFYNCAGLTGASPANAVGSKLWELSGPPSGAGCFYNCSGLADYASIPAGWKSP